MSAHPFIHRRRRGFTLIEMLVVISIIVLSLALAIPLFSVMSGDRSVDGAENIVSAMLQRARARAIGLQDRRGVFFFEDPKTRNVMMVVVKIYDSPPTMTTPGLYIDVDPQLPEAQSLPVGVGAAFIVGKTSASANTSYAKLGLVSFDALGRFEPLAYNFEPTKNMAGGASVWQTQYFFDNTYRIATSMSPAELSRSHVGLMLYDKKSFKDVDTSNTSPTLFSATESQWLDGASGMGKSGGLPLMINRYNGTLIRGE